MAVAPKTRLNEIMLKSHSIFCSCFNLFKMCFRAETYGSFTRVYPKVSEMAALSENWKRYSSPPLDAVVSLYCESV
jgi:hypothetical protein